MIVVGATLLQAVAFWRSEVPGFFWLLLAFCILARLVLGRVLSIHRRHFVATMVWIQIELDFFGWLATMPEAFKDQLTLSAASVQFSMELGMMCLGVHAMLVWLWSPSHERGGRGPEFPVPQWPGIPTTAAMNVAPLLLIMGFGISIMANRLGLTAMGQLHPELPFRLAGVIALFKDELFPDLSILMLDILYEKRPRAALVYFLGYVAWLVLEGMFRLSRGTVTLGLIPIGIWCIYRRLINVRFVFVSVAAVAAAMMAFPYMTALRSARDTTDLTTAQIIRQGLGEADDPIIERFEAAFIRFSLNGFYVAKFANISQSMYYENRLREVYEAGGPSRYHTVVIDGRDAATDSAGSAGIAAPYLMGGVPLALLSMGVLSLLAMAIDRGAIPAAGSLIAGRVFAVYYLFNLVNNSFIEVFFHPVRNAIYAVAFPLILSYVARYSLGRVKHDSLARLRNGSAPGPLPRGGAPGKPRDLAEETRG